MRSFSLSLSRGFCLFRCFFQGIADGIFGRFKLERYCGIFWRVWERVNQLFSIINVEFLFILTVHGVYLYWQCNYGYIVGRLFEEI